MAAKTPKSSAPTTYDRKLITVWKNVAEKALARGYASMSKLIGQPGVWDALAAALDAGKVPPAALWRFDEQTFDRVPARHAVAVLGALPPDLTHLWHVYRLSAALVLAQVLADASALDGLRAEGPEVLRDVIDIARIAAGVDPAGGASARVRASIGQHWPTGNLGLHPAAVVDGRAGRVGIPGWPMTSLDAMRALGESLLGPVGLVETLAAGHRARIAAHDASSAYEQRMPMFVDPDAVVIAAGGLTPEETCSFQVPFGTLLAASARWSVDEMVRAALATARRARPDGYMVAGSLAVLALFRDPACAPRVEGALQLGDVTNAASPGVANVYNALARTDPAWLRDFLDRRVFAPDAYPGTYAGPIAVALLAAIDPDEAERRAAQSPDAFDWVRLNGVDPAVLLASADRAGPLVRRGLSFPILSGYSRTAPSAPARVDDLVVFDGTGRDGWMTPYLVALPPDRAGAVVRREESAGRGELARAALAGAHGGAALLAALG
jgi:hypothetical protein